MHSGGDIDAMTSSEPINNVARMALNAFTAAAGGVQSLQVPCYDEAYEIPTDDAILNALRVQQIVAYESGVRYTADPFAGSYFVESLTAQVRDQLIDLIDHVTSTGGSIAWISDGRMQAAVAAEARAWEERVADGREVRVGLNSGNTGFAGSHHIAVHPFSAEAAEAQVASLIRLRADRDDTECSRALDVLRQAANDGSNVMEPLIAAAKAGATLGETSHVMTSVYGAFVAPSGI